VTISVIEEKKQQKDIPIIQVAGFFVLLIKWKTIALKKLYKTTTKSKGWK